MRSAELPARAHTPIVHRDVKPANIRITPDGNAVLVDFGINKIFDITLKTTMGAQAVTAGFSPPELYGYGNADARSDVYALGATLYALLTGQTPVESVQRAIGIELPAPSSLNPRLTPQTEAAILKAMALLPADRYQSAAEFLADLPTPQAVTLHTEDLPRTVLTPPIASHPPAMQQASKRGLPAWVLWIGATIVVLAALAVGSYFIRQQRQEQLFSATQLALAQVTLTPTHTTTRTPLPSLTSTPAPPTLTPTFTPTTSPTATETPTPTLTPELPLLQGTSLPQGREVISMNNVTDLQLLARWGSGTIEEIAWSPDGNWLAAGGSIGVHVYDLHSLEVVTFIETDYGANSVAFSPDGSLLAAGMEDNSIRLWQTTDWSPLRTITGHTGPVLSIAFAPDGSMLASGSQDYTIRLWRIPDGTLVRSFTQPTEPVIRVQYSPDGNTLATITGDRLARLWSVASGTYLRTLANGTNSVSFSPDSTLLATGRTYGGIEVWGVEDGASIPAQSAGDGDMLVTFSPNGTTLASASWYGLLSLGSITGATSTSSWYGHADAVSSLAFSPDGARLASAAMDGSLKLWQVSDQTLLGSIEGHSSNLTSLALTRDGAYLAAGFNRGTIQIRFPTNGAIWQTWVDPVVQDAAIVDLEYSPTGTTLLSVSAFIDSDYSIFLWWRRKTLGSIQRNHAGVAVTIWNQCCLFTERANPDAWKLPFQPKWRFA